jgi:indolepyruvate ferredoxin oxidoreductase beta subunit
VYHTEKKEKGRVVTGKKPYNILMVGVGGQGIITASDILTQAALIHGYDAKKSEIHGMSQRGGSVSSHVRFGEVVYSPVITPGTVDILLSLEEMEALRWIGYAGKHTLVVVCQTMLKPAMVEEYPTGVEEELRNVCPKLFLVDPKELGERIEREVFFNVALLGLISPMLDIPETAWLEAISGKVPQRFRDQNISAFKQGMIFYQAGLKEVLL